MDTLRQQFGDDFSSSAFREFSGDPAIVGKWGVITQLDDQVFDCWFVKPELSPMSGRKLTNIAKNLPEEWGLTRLTGEGYTQGRGREFVLRVAVLAGVKRKRRMSEESKRAAAERLRQVREDRK